MPVEQDIYIAGIGCSAGGVEALCEFFNEVPDGSNIGFIVMSHLSRIYKSNLPLLISKWTKLPVFKIRGGELVLPNCVYVLPEDMELTIENRTLLLEKRSMNKINRIIDKFFCSLSDDMKEKAIGIILSGAGFDGTEGVKKIHDGGGIVIVQKPATAKFKSMPLSAIKQDHPDQVLSPRHIATTLGGILKK